jgi:hypothetical protein
MAIFDTICFPNPDPVTGLPTLDGWTGNTDPGLIGINFPDEGYSTGGRVTFAGGAKVPPVAFQTMFLDLGPADIAAQGLPVAPGAYLLLGMFCAFDPTFDDHDGVTIALRPTRTSPHTDARRIDLFPNTLGVGAGVSTATWPTSLPGDPPQPPPQPPLYRSRLGVDLRETACWKGKGANPAPVSWPPPAPLTSRWDSIAAPANLWAKATSWQPATVATTAAGTQTWPTTTLAVASVSQFPPSGNLTVQVGGVDTTIAYTGVVDTAGSKQFTGCTAHSGTAGGTIAAGSTVQLQDVGWSIEVLIPTTTALGGAIWIDIAGQFSLYINLYRLSYYLPAPQQPFASYSAQYRFPLPDPTATGAGQLFLTTIGDVMYVGDDWYGKASVPALGGVNDAVGVCFQNVADPLASVGVRHLSPDVPNQPLDEWVYGQHGTLDNTLVAQVKNTDPSNPAQNVTAEFRFGKWGTPPAGFGDWDPATAHGASLPTTVNLGTAGSATDRNEITSSWLHTDVPVEYEVSDVWPGHHCVWVRLDSTGNVNFVQGGVRDNFNFVQLSEHSADATLSGRGYAPPRSGTDHDFVLLSHIRSAVLPEEGEGERSADSDRHVYYWMIDVFRRTGLTFTAGKTKAEILDPSPGQFGLVGAHYGDAADIIATQLAGKGVRRVGNAYEVRVPHGGETTVGVWIGAGPEGKVIPPAPPDDGPPSQSSWWEQLLRWIVELLKRLFGRK